MGWNHQLVRLGLQIMGLTSRCFESCFCTYPGASMWLVYLPTFNHKTQPNGDKYTRSHGKYGSYFLYSLKLTTNIIAPKKIASQKEMSLPTMNFQSYCWWKKSCTSWLSVYHIIFRVLYIPLGFPSTVEILHHLGCIKLIINGINWQSTGASFLPSTVRHFSGRVYWRYEAIANLENATFFPGWWYGYVWVAFGSWCWYWCQVQLGLPNSSWESPAWGGGPQNMPPARNTPWKINGWNLQPSPI